MSTSTTNYGLIKPTDNEAADITVINGNMDVIDGKLKGIDSGKEPLIRNAVSKTAIVDSDVLPLIDSADNNNTKKVSFGKFKDSINEATSSGRGFMSATDKVKLDGIATNANNYIHPTTTGNKHIPSGGTAGQILRNTADGTATWQELLASNISVSASIQTLFGKTNVDDIIQKIWNDITKPYNHIVEITTSQNWISPITGEITVFIVGGGGNGSSGSAGKPFGSGGSGGPGGSCVELKLRVVAGTSYPVVIGAGGGGNSSFSKYFAKGAGGNNPGYAAGVGNGDGSTSNHCTINGKDYAGGGSGGEIGYSNGPSPAGTGGSAGDGNPTSTKNGANASPNTGAGGGGGGGSANIYYGGYDVQGFGGNGGSGIVIIGYYS